MWRAGSRGCWSKGEWVVALLSTADAMPSNAEISAHFKVYHSMQTITLVFRAPPSSHIQATTEPSWTPALTRLRSSSSRPGSALFLLSPLALHLWLYEGSTPNISGYDHRSEHARSRSRRHLVCLIEWTGQARSTCLGHSSTLLEQKEKRLLKFSIRRDELKTVMLVVVE